MARVIVTTDDGHVIWESERLEPWHVEGGKLTGRMNVRASATAAGIVRAVQDAERIQAGLDPERPSERAMRLSTPREENPPGGPRSEGLLVRQWYVDAFYEWRATLPAPSDDSEAFEAAMKDIEAMVDLRVEAALAVARRDLHERGVALLVTER